MLIDKSRRLVCLFLSATLFLTFQLQLSERRTQKPPLHARHWMAITGKPLAGTAGAMIFQKGGNAVDAACAMIAATCTMWGGSSSHGEDYGIAW